MFPDSLPTDREFAALRPARYELPTAKGKCWCDLTRTSPEGVFPETFLINTLFTDPRARGRGFGRMLMNELVTLADIYNVTLVLKPASFDPHGPDDEALERFYSTFGFAPLRSGYWERLPVAISQYA